MRTILILTRSDWVCLPKLCYQYHMTKNRLEAFSDGVLAIIITIMVLEMKAPISSGWSALTPLIPVFLSYVLSFVYVGIYWNNHHHLFHSVHKVNGKILWANLHLLFWLSLVPVVTAWAGETHFDSIPMMLYGFVLMMCGVAYRILVIVLIKAQGAGSTIAKAIGTDFKGKISVVIYLAAIAVACWVPWLAALGYMSVAAIWLIPDTRFEKLTE